jgi:hypothetical protein
VSEVDKGEILDFFLKKCSAKKIYYVHNLTFEMFVFLKHLVNKQIKFKIISSDRVVYAAEIFYKKKKIRLRCSYRLTMLSLKDLAKLAEVEEKTIFPYKILNKNITEYVSIKENMFKDENEYCTFLKMYGNHVNIFKILEEYCKNDALITKSAIIKY